MIENFLPYFFWPFNPFKSAPTSFVWADILYLLIIIGGLWLSYFYTFHHKQKIESMQMLYSATISVNMFALLVSIGLSFLKRCDATYIKVYGIITVVSFISAIIWYLSLKYLKYKEIKISNVKMVFNIIVSTLCFVCLQVYLGALFFVGCGDKIGWHLLFTL